MEPSNKCSLMPEGFSLQLCSCVYSRFTHLHIAYILQQAPVKKRISQLCVISVYNVSAHLSVYETAHTTVLLER